MKLLFTSDWQASWTNLAQCRATVKHILEICEEEGITTVVHCGDIKHTLNPVDVRVVNFIIATCRKFQRAGIHFIALLGNHDMVGMHDESPNWFPALRAAGAAVIDTPVVTSVGEGFSIHAVPFARQVSRGDFRSVTASANPETSLLIFHQELYKSMYNLSQTCDSKSLRLRDLKPERYMFCLGGHIHLGQRVSKNVYYVGSPFAHDWGEANQRKGFLVVDLARRKLKFTESKLPGMYDPTLPGYHRPKKWDGARVRVHVSFDRVSKVNVQAFIDKATTKAEKDYPGASISVVVKYSDSVEASTLEGDSDSEVVAAYVRETCPASVDATEAKGTILWYVSQYGTRNADQTIEFIRGQARNLLCFKRLAVDYQFDGITVVTGTNTDWPNRNNGSGKTSYLQLPAIALFGKTLKGQSHNRWIRRRSNKKAPAWVDFEFRLRDGRCCKVHRSRRPVKLQLIVEGKDLSTGLGVAGTQSRIEALTGLSWDTLSNGMYIDQSDVNILLRGTDADHKKLFSRLLGLERFTSARDDVSRRISSVTRHLLDIEADAAHLQDKREEVRELLKKLPKVSITSIREEHRRAKASYAKAKKQVAKIGAIYKHSREYTQETLLSAEGSLSTMQRDIGEVHAVEANSRKAATRIEQMGNRCSECGQKVSRQYVKQAVASHKEALHKAEDEEKVLQAELDKIIRLRSKVEIELKKLRTKLDNANQQLSEASSMYDLAKRDYEQAQEQQEIRQQFRDRIRELGRLHKRVVAYIGIIQDTLVYLSYCLSALSKDGIPAYLTASMCPQLNAAADWYSELFCDSEIQVKFAMERRDIDVQIINAHGGSEVIDQSAGETRVASIIIGFAIRQVTNPTNVLILDEPGESLDAYNAKKFAEGLREAVHRRGGSIMLTTHSPYILGELEGERLIEVVKRNGVSTCQ